MKTLVVVLLTTFALGCGGYGSGSSSNSRSMAAGTPSISPPLVPNMATAGSTAFTLTVNGTGFVAQSIIYWNSMAHSTTFVTSSQLTAAIAASDVATAGTITVYVRNPGGTGIYMNQMAQNSNPVNFTVQ